jgi:hypothetical protein
MLKCSSFISLKYHYFSSIPVATRSKVWVCSHSLAGNVGSNLTGGTDVSLL